MTSPQRPADAQPARIAACPQCGKSARLDTQNPARPFCSHRCKMIDLGAWFGEQRGLPAEDQGDD